MNPLNSLSRSHRSILIAAILALLTISSLLAFQMPALASSVPGSPQATQIAFKPNTIIHNDITSDTTWDLAGSPYEITTSINVINGVKLTVDPGVQVFFDQYAGLAIAGTLTAVGTATQPITFTATTQDPGWWDGISIAGTDAAHLNTGSSLDYVTISYGGGSGPADLNLSFASATINHSQFNNSYQDGIYAENGGVADIANSSFSSNQGYAVNFNDASVNPTLANLSASGNLNASGELENGVAFGSGTLDGQHTWSYTGIPYFVQNNLYVASSGSLAVDPGVQVLFEQYAGLTANGPLVAEGTATQPITFTATTQDPGWWDGISIAGTDAAHLNTGSSLDYVTISYGGGSGPADLNLSFASVTINHSQFNNSYQDGIYAENGGVADIANSSFSSNEGYAVNFNDASVNPTLANLSASGNLENGVAFGSGTLDGQHTWSYTGIPYFVQNNLNVAGSGSLAVDPGVQVLFEQYAGLTANGPLVAEGTATQPITFTATTQDPGWWDGISIAGTDAAHLNTGSSLDYVTISYGGGSGPADLTLSFASVTINHSQFNNSYQDGIYAENGGVADIANSSFSSNDGYAVNFNDGSVNPTLAKLSASGNLENGVAFGSGTLDGQHTWNTAGVPYILRDNLSVANSGSLTIGPGVQVLFEQYAGLTANGPLIAEGTATQPITFTATTQNRGWWDGIGIYGTDTDHNIGSVLQYVVVEYGGGSGADISVGNAQVSISHSILRESGGDGLYIDQGGAGSNIEISQIVNNDGDAVNNQDSHTFMAANNWWGDINGPQVLNDCNPGGNGGVIEGDVAFRPFLTSADGNPGNIAPSDTRILTLTPQRWFVPADGVSKAWIKIVLRDGNGLPLPGREVSLNTTLGSVTDGGITDYQGQTFAYVTSDTAGEAALTPSLSYQNTCETARGATARVTFTAPPAGGDPLPDASAPYMNDDIQIDPLPVTRGVPTTITANYSNPNDYPVTITSNFGFAQAGIGLTFGPLGQTSTQIPAHGSGSAQITWTPSVSGHYCVQVSYTVQGSGGSGGQTHTGTAQRNLDVAPAHLSTFHQRDTLNKAKTSLDAISKAQTVLDLATSPENISGFFIPNYLFSQIIDFNFSWWSQASNALAMDPPRQDYQTIATLEHYTFTPAQPGNGVSQERADAANALMSASLDLTAKLKAATISLDRYAGASQNDDLTWASQQAAAYLYYRSASAKAMQNTADKLDTMLQVLQKDGIPDRSYTVDEIKAYLQRLQTQGFNQTEIDAAKVIDLTDNQIETILQERINSDPAQGAGSVRTLLSQMSTALRTAGQALADTTTSGLTNATLQSNNSSAPTATNNLIRVYQETYPLAIANSSTQSETIRLRVRPIDLPADWGAAVSPITVTLKAGEQTTVHLTVAPGTAAVQGTHPRVSVEGYVNNELIGGVVQDVIVPDTVAFDGKIKSYLPDIFR